MKAKILYLVLLVSLIIPTMPVHATEMNSMASSYEEEDTGENQIPPLTYKEIEDPVESVLLDPAYDGPVYSSLETTYNPLTNGQNLPPIRDQNPYGSCWAHSSVGFGEMAYYKANTSERDMELSELHLAYFTYLGENVGDPLGGLDGDYNDNVGSDIMDRGGNLALASNVLSCWVGAADEDIAPYEDAAAILNGTKSLPKSVAFTDRMHLQGVRKINMTDTALVKQMVKECGAVGISYYDNDYRYSDEYKSYYCEQAVTSNHAVMIIGWDDNFSKDNFRIQAPSDGAWLIRNSWGGPDNEYSHFSYFWLSYADVTIYETGYVFLYEDINSPNYYDNNYQYDGAMQDGSISLENKVMAANVFKAKANPEGEVLKAVSFATDSVNLDYTIQIYINLADPTDPESGTLVDEATVRGQTSTAGYYTVALSKEVALTEGTTFAAVVTLEKESADIGISLEYDYDSWYKSVASAEAGQSFLKSGYYWQDMGDTNGVNIRIKAFTDNLTINNALTSLALSDTNKVLNKGDSYTLTANKTPANADGVLMWSSSEPSVASVGQNGKVTALKAGTAVITASCGNISASCLITVEVPVESVSLSQTSVELIECDAILLTATIEPADYTEEVIWSSSDTQVANVNNNGMVSAVAPGNAVITVTAGSKKAQCDVVVKANYIPAQTITISKQNLELDKGDSYTLTATVFPQNYSLGKVSWSSSAPSVASVDSNGVITAKETGTATITASADDVSQSCQVTVKIDGIIIDVTNFPDDNFREYVSECDTNSNGYLSEEEIDSVTGMYIQGKNIQNLKGIEYFTGLKTLSCGSNKLSNLDVSKCVNLESLSCGNNPLIALNIGNSSKIKNTTINAFLNSNSKVFDFSEYAYFNVGKVSDLNGLLLNGKIFTVDNCKTGSYHYDCGNGNVLIVNLTNNAYKEPTPDPDPTPTPDPDPTPTPKPTPSWQFKDVAVKPGNWKYEAVKFVYDNGIMNGVGDGTSFDPDAPLTREMFATVLYRMAGEPSVTYTGKFPDVPRGKWYSNAVIWASEQGIVGGYGDGRFGTGDYITREQIAKMFMEYGRKQGNDVSHRADFSTFADAGKVSGWAKDYMKWAVGSGMIGGSMKDGKYYLNPKGMQREQRVRPC